MAVAQVGPKVPHDAAVVRLWAKGASALSGVWIWRRQATETARQGLGLPEENSFPVSDNSFPACDNSFPRRMLSGEENVLKSFFRRSGIRAWVGRVVVLSVFFSLPR